MLSFDIARICAERGINNASLWLREQAFRSNYITTILRKKPSVRLSLQQIEKICLALHCTPNELFSWMPDAGKPVAPNHQMHALVRNNKPSIPDLMRSLPAEQLEQVRELMMQLKSGAGSKEGA